MKKLLIPAILLFLIPVTAEAHIGSLGLFVDANCDDCDLNPPMYMTSEFVICYVRSDGPNGIFGAEFKVNITSALAFITGESWSPAVSIHSGDVTSNKVISFATCQGVDEDYVYIGTLTLLNTGDDQPFYGLVQTSDDVVEEPFTPHVAMCDVAHTMVECLGGAMVFNGSCDIAVKKSTWGAIKSMY